jgi:hypothetical protein
MTTPNITSPNVRLVAKEASVPADDSNLRGPTPGEIQPVFVAEIFDGALKDEADHATALAIAGQGMVAEWWEGVEERVYLGPFMFPRPRTVTPAASAGRFPAAASPPAGPSVPVAKLSIVAAPVAEPEREHACEVCGVTVTGGEIGPGGLHWLCEDHRSEPGEDGCPACGGTHSERFYVAGLNGPVTCSDDWHDDDAAGPGRPAPVTEPVYDISPGAFITEVVTGAPEPAAEQEAAEEPDATQVIAVTDAPTEAVPVVKEGESDE